MNHRSNVERTYKMVSKPESCLHSGISMTETCLLVRRYPAKRWREPDSGFYAELREPVAAMIRERHKQGNCKAENRSAAQGRTNL